MTYQEFQKSLDLEDLRIERVATILENNTIDMLDDLNLSNFEEFATIKKTETRVYNTFHFNHIEDDYLSDIKQHDTVRFFNSNGVAVLYYDSEIEETRLYIQLRNAVKIEFNESAPKEFNSIISGILFSDMSFIN